MSGSEATPRFDAVIAGAGLAGASLAARLAGAGLRVALLDAASFPRDKLCGEYLSPEGVLALERLGLEACRGGQPIHRVRLSTPRGTLIEAEVSGPDGRPGLGLSRSALDQAIVRLAISRGASLFESTRVVGPLIEEGRVVGLLARGPDHESMAIRAGVTVAADGRHSALVKKTGRTRARSRLPTRPALFGLKRHFTVPADRSDATEPEGSVGLHLVAGGYGGTCRVEGGLTNFCALLPESALKRHRGDLDRLAATELAVNPTLARLFDAATPAGDWKTVAGVRVETSTPGLPGILYAGDCRGTVDPLGGQGMTMALLGPEILAPFVIEAVKDGADARLQRRYEAAWNARFDRRIALCRAFHHVLVRPGLLDASRGLGRAWPRLLYAAFDLTRDRGR